MEPLLILVYPDMTPVGLDIPRRISDTVFPFNASGGYPYRATRTVDAHIWTNDEERTRYQQMFEKEGFLKAKMTTPIFLEDV